MDTTKLPGLKMLVSLAVRLLPPLPLDEDLPIVESWLVDCFRRGWTVLEAYDHVKWSEYVTGSDEEAPAEDLCLRMMDETARRANARVGADGEALQR